MEPITAYGHTYIPTMGDAEAWRVDPEKWMFVEDIFDYHIGAEDDRVVNAIEAAYVRLLDGKEVT